MNVALIADTHGTLDPRIAQAIEGFDLIVHAGDVGAAVSDQLDGYDGDIVIVRGNNDPQTSPWPDERLLDLPGGKLAVSHGHRWPARVRHQRLRRAYPNALAIVCGHSHRRLCDRSVLPWVLNPGAAGRTRAYGGPGWLALSATPGDWRVQMHEYEAMSRKS